LVVTLVVTGTATDIRTGNSALARIRWLTTQPKRGKLPPLPKSIQESFWRLQFALRLIQRS
jgi:hypothetical protein